jgi:hypothetical protein
MSPIQPLLFLAASALVLASDASEFMTGAVIAVDGGHLVSTLETGPTARDDLAARRRFRRMKPSCRRPHH